MKFGLHGINYGSCSIPENMIHAAQAAERCGFDSLWTGEHIVLPDPPPRGFHQPPDRPYLDSLIALTYLAAHTRTIRLATGIIILPQRNPLVLAKELASLDVLSAGRLVVGLGVGYLEPEFEALGIPFEERGERTDDYLAAMEAIWSQPKPAYHGRFASFANVQSYPRPLQRPMPPLVFGGQALPALRRALERGHGWYGFDLNLSGIARVLETLQQLALPDLVTRPTELGKLEISVHLRVPLTIDLVEQLAAMGVDRVVVSLPLNADADTLTRFIERIAKMMIKK
jgi:probable F420-dependent oxidoreductase